ncbi:PucR family transcriptional regulator ligand-binding domain-containing protein [Streptomyces sp. NPDC060006]|uniref:PucR family transcriptional regulator ligand-binding domain-containing protein n=1 Tax=unclassified Streptomyces TaxID=2593676 RepID=UPI0036388418
MTAVLSAAPVIGELVLTTGMPLPQDPADVRRYVDEPADASAAALVIALDVLRDSGERPTRGG